MKDTAIFLEHSLANLKIVDANQKKKIAFLSKNILNVTCPDYITKKKKKKTRNSEAPKGNVVISQHTTQQLSSFTSATRLGLMVGFPARSSLLWKTVT